MKHYTSQAHAPATDGEFALKVEGLSKAFAVYATPRDRLKQFVLPRLQRLAGQPPRSYFREFWALREVSFQVGRGETVAIIGRNGAGKSTLLQIISGTLSQSAGHVETRGRIAALLELGAGFNPEFTGRENVFLNGAILGLTPDEVEARFDEIAAFAEIGDFIEQPVKTYSSGMFVRLAFAVQACVDPDILIVDEALAVGDIGFQYKCYKRMEALRDRGTTILMVTHGTGSVLEYADRCLVMEAGRIVVDTRDVLAAVLAYEKGMLQSRLEHSVQVARPDAGKQFSVADLQALQASSLALELGEKRFGTARALIERLIIRKATGGGDPSEPVPVMKSGEEVVFQFHLRVAEPLRNVVLGVSLSRPQGADVWGDNNLHAGQPLDLGPGEHVLEYRVRLPLSPGEYLVHAGLACLDGERREELDQRRPLAKLRFWAARAQVGVVYAPVQVFVAEGEAP
ncbi:MAG: ABC transporter ATP-binding protein [Pseudomonadota bacterium]